MRLSLSPLQARVAGLLASRRPTTVDRQGAQQAGVAVLIAPDPDAVLLIRRAERLGDPWSGHMGLPGGRREPGDVDLRATAQRETWEEVGLALPDATYLGQLDDVSPRTPLLKPIVVRPFVFALSERLPLTLSEEVALALWVEVKDLAGEGIYRPYALELRGEVRSFPAYHLGEHVVWGMTERILTPLLELARGEGRGP